MPRRHSAGQRVYALRHRLELNHWGASGDWTVGQQIATVDAPGGRIVHRFHRRDLNLVLAHGRAASTRFRVLIEGGAANDSRGLDVDEAATAPFARSGSTS